MIDFGGGMIFPSSYGRDQFSAQQEARQEAGQAADEARAELSADAHQEGIEAATRAVYEYIACKGPKVLARPKTMARTAIDAYLEALNAH